MKQANGPVPKSVPPSGPTAPVVHLVELEFVRRHLALALASAHLKALEIAQGIVVAALRELLEARLVGREIKRVERRGRQLRLRIGDDMLALTLRPGCALYLASPQSGGPERPLLSMGFGVLRLWVYGQRSCFGLELVTDAEGAGRAALAIAEHAVEPLAAAFTLGGFKRILRNKKRTILQLLVDDELISGIGDPYADEILFAARLRPTRPVPSLSEEEIRTLYYSILEVLQKAIRFGGVGAEGTALLEGRPGTFSRFLTVHGREGQECPTCRARIRVSTMGKAVSCYCPQCQI